MKAFIVLLLLLLFSSCSTTKPESPKLFALDSFQTPIRDKVNWKSEITRTVFKNQTTGFVVKGDLCLLSGKAQKILPIEIDYPSAIEYEKGTYYDAMIPMTEENCSDAEFAWLELNESFNSNGLNIKINKLQTESLDPKITMFIQLEPYAYTKGLHKGKYVDNTEYLALDGLRMLAEHRIQPIKSWVTPYGGYSNTYGFKEYVKDFSPNKVNIPQDGNLSLLSSDISKYKINDPWIYLVDEPSNSTLNAYKTVMANLRKNMPNAKLMVTTTFKKGMDIDIYCPVLEQLGHDGHPTVSDYKDKKLWLYTSCMSHGNCGENRDWVQNKVTYSKPNNRTGTPGLELDANSYDAFGFFQIAIKYDVEALLYYNSIEQWAIAKYGVDIFKDQYNFGGNGDGTLIYPDYENKKPLPSLRLKMLREASFFADAVIMSNSQKDISHYIDDTKKWNFNYIEREKIFQKLK